MLAPLLFLSRKGWIIAMLQGKSGTELGLASTAVLINLLHRLVEQGLLKREAARALLGDAADELATQSGETTRRQLSSFAKRSFPRSKAASASAGTLHLVSSSM